MYIRRLIGLALPALILAGGLLPVQASLATAPPRHSMFFAGLVNGHLYRSATGISDWQEADHGLPTGPPIDGIFALAVTPDGSTIFAGPSYAGIYTSSDGGRHWTNDNGNNPLLANSFIVSFVVDPTDSQIAYALSEDTFFVSRDAGHTWLATPLPGVTGDIVATALAASRQAPGVLLISTTGVGVLRSSDRGAHWVTTGFPVNYYAQDVAFSPSNANVAYATTNRGIFQTSDGGKSWRHDQQGIPPNNWFEPIVADPANARHIVAASEDQFYFSPNGGTTWSNQGPLGHTAFSLIFDPTHPGTMLAGTTDGSAIYQSADNGSHWTAYATGFPAKASVLSLAATTGSLLPTYPVPMPSRKAVGVRYFPQTQHAVREPFLTFYNTENGLKIFGLPLTEAFTDGGQTVQYFERAELIAGQTGVTEAHLGSLLTQDQSFPAVPAFVSTPTNRYFTATKHSLSGAFLTFWQSHQGATLLGSPISEPLKEENGDGTGRTYLVQYFQNARLEYHPEPAGAGNEVELGLLGKEALQQRGWL